MPEAIYRTVVERIFIAFAARDDALCTWLQDRVDHLQWRDDELHFSIEELFSWACALHSDASPVATKAHTPLFLAFRRMLYQQPTNTELRAYGVQVQLCDSHPQQRGLPRRYVLRRLIDVVATD